MTIRKTATANSDSDPAICPPWVDLTALPPALQLANALALSAETHLHHPRKVSGAPYLSHPMLAAGMVLKAGGTVRAAQIALLHDVVEEGGALAHANLHHRFCSSICTAVAAMTPSAAESALPWAEKKQRSIDRMSNTSDGDVAMAFAADKSATLYEMEADIEALGTFKVLSKLRGSCDELLWYYQTCWHALTLKVNAPMSSLLRGHVDCLRRRVEAYPFGK